MVIGIQEIHVFPRIFTKTHNYSLSESGHMCIKSFTKYTYFLVSQILCNIYTCALTWTCDACHKNHSSVTIIEKFIKFHLLVSDEPND